MTNPILDIIQKQNEINEQAYKTFEADFHRRNPAPNTDSRLEQIGMSIGLLASLILSGLLTIPVFTLVLGFTSIGAILSTAGGVAGFVMIDVLMVITVNGLVRSIYKPQALKGRLNYKTIIVMMAITVVFGFTVSASSNLYFIYFGFGVVSVGTPTGDFLSLFVGTLLAFAPPIQSVATGTIIALMPLNNILEQAAYDSKKRGEWTRFKNTNGLNLDVGQLTERYLDGALVRLEMPVHEFHEFHEIHEKRETPVKLSPKRKKVHDYLTMNPNAMDMQVSELADTLNLSVGLVSEERGKWYRNN